MTRSARPLRPLAHRLPPRRRRPHGALQLALRPADRRHLRPAHRGHRPGAQHRRRTPASSSTGSSWLGITWDEGPFFQGAYGAAPPGRRRAPARRGQGLPLLLHPGGARRAARARPRRRAAASATTGAATGSTADEIERRARAPARRSPSASACPTSEIAWDDAVHGRISFQGRDLDDFVILRSDGTPIYNLAVVSDDIAMRITHVIRGDDHISNTPKQIALYRALGAEPPVFAHVPMILGTDGKKLSQAPRRHRGRRLPGPGHPARRDAELPRAARLVARRRPRDHARGRDDRAVHARGHPEEGGGLRHRPSSSG